MVGEWAMGRFPASPGRFSGVSWGSTIGGEQARIPVLTNFLIFGLDFMKKPSII
jgi:hypothetical protein